MHEGIYSREVVEPMTSDRGERYEQRIWYIGCVDPTIIEPMVIFILPHVPWYLKPIPVPRAHIPKRMELLKQKVEMGILEPSSAPYSNRRFTMPKKNGVVNIFDNGVKIKWNKQNREGAMCTCMKGVMVTCVR